MIRRRSTRRFSAPLAGAVVLLCVALLTALVAAPAQAAVVLPAPPVTPTFGAWIDPIQGYDPATQCLTTVQPGTELLKDLLTKTYGRTAFDTLRACSGGVATSEHNDGRALDFMLSAAVPADAAVASSFLTWLLKTDDAGVAVANARRLGIMYVIWNRQMWQAVDPVWRPYTGTSPHTDHIHISLSWVGARLQTSFWQPYLSTACDSAVSVCALPTAAVDVYTAPGYHVSGGRIWSTWCEPYGTATRCWTSIKASQVALSASGSYVVVYGWAFNNLTYVDRVSPSWEVNPLAIPGAQTIGGRSWNVVCSVPVASGARVCQDYIWTTGVSRVLVGGVYVFQPYAKFVYNSVVRLAAPLA